MADRLHHHDQAAGVLSPKVRSLIDDAATAFREFWEGYWKSPPGC